MFDISVTADGTISLVGRLDTVQADRLREQLAAVGDSRTVDFSQLDYISSAGLGVLLGTQKRLGELGHRLKLVNLNDHIGEVFRIAGFDHVFDIA